MLRGVVLAHITAAAFCPDVMPLSEAEPPEAGMLGTAKIGFPVGERQFAASTAACIPAGGAGTAGGGDRKPDLDELCSSSSAL